MRFQNSVYRTSLALALAGGAVLMAQSTTGSLNGVVRDSKGQPLPGVRVAIESPALFRPKVHITDAKGEFRDPLLPVGYYTVAVSKEGFLGQKAENLRIGVGANLRREFTLKSVNEAQATVEVLAGSATLDKSDTKESRNFSAGLLEALPTTKTFSGVADLSPGLEQAGPGGIRIRGGESIMTQYKVNGADFSNVIYDYSRANRYDSYVISDNVEDIQVVLSALNAKEGRSTSGQLNVVTKAGGNDFAGSIRAIIGRNSWQADPHKAFRSSYLGGTYADDLSKRYEITFNGPIIKDRLWFSLGTVQRPDTVSQWRRDTFGQRPEDGGFGYYCTTGNPLIDGQIQSQFNALQQQGYSMWFGDMVPENTKLYSSITKRTHYEGKLTWGINVDHTVEYSIFSDETKQSLDPANTGMARDSTFGPYSDGSVRQVVGYRGVLAPNLFLEVKGSRMDNTTKHAVGDTTFNEEMILNSANAQGYHYNYDAYPHWGGEAKVANTGWVSAPEKTMNRTFNANLKAFWSGFGQHESDLGLDYYAGHYRTAWGYGDNNRKFQVGGILAKNRNDTPDQWRFLAVNWDPKFDYGYQGGYFDPTSGYEHQWWYPGSSSYGPAPYVIQFLGHDGQTTNATSSAYLNDAWTLNKHWNVMVGLRFDHYLLQDTDGATRGDSSRFSPRLGLKFDPKGDAKHVYSFSFARYSSDYPQNFVRRFLTLSDAKSIEWGWSANSDYTDRNPSKPLASWVDWSAITNMANYGHLISTNDSSKEALVDPNVKTPYTDEITFGYRRNYAQGHLSLTYVHRAWHDLFAFSQQWDPHYLVVEGDPRPNPDPTLPKYNKLAWTAGNSDVLKRWYNGLEMEWEQRFGGHWGWGGNLNWSELMGNDDSLDTTSTHTISPSLNYSEILTRSKAYGGYGLSMDQLNPTRPLSNGLSGTLWVTYTLPLGKGHLSLAPMLKFWTPSTSGIYVDAPFSPGLPDLPLADPKAAAPNKPTTYARYLASPRDYSGVDGYTADFKLSLDLPIGLKGLRLIGDLTINNVFNHHYLTKTWIPTQPAPKGTDRYLIKPSEAQFAGTNRWFDGAGNLSTDNYFTDSRSASFSVGLRF